MFFILIPNTIYAQPYLKGHDFSNGYARSFTVCSISGHVLAVAECTSSFEEMQDCADLCTHTSNETAREAAYEHPNFCK